MPSWKWNNYDVLAPVKFKSNRFLWSVEKLDLSIDRSASAAQRWEIEFSVLGDEVESDLVQSMIAEFDSVHSMVMPSFLNLYNRWTRPVVGGIVTDAVGAVGERDISIIATQPNQHLSRGAFCQFSNHDKIYSCQTDFFGLSEVSSTYIRVFPKLRATVPSGTTIKFFDDVTLNYYIDESVDMSINYIDGKLVGMDSIKLIEAI